MASRKPLVVVAGQVQQIQAGDTLDAVIGGGDQVNLTNGEATPVVIGAPVYLSANGTFKKAQANAAGTKDVIGVVAQSPSIANAAIGPVTTDGIVTATTAEWDAVTGQVGGLVFNTLYFLDPATAGKLAPAGPSTVGQYVVPVGRAISTTELQVRVGTSILL